MAVTGHHSWLERKTGYGTRRAGVLVEVHDKPRFIGDDVEPAIRFQVNRTRWTRVGFDLTILAVWFARRSVLGGPP